MDGFTVKGEDGFAACEINVDGAAGLLAGSVEVVPGTPVLYAGVADPVTGGPVTGARITVTAPDGTVHSTAKNTGNTLVVLGTDGRPRALVLRAPAPGTWTLACQADEGVRACAALITVPAADPLANALLTLSPHWPGGRAAPSDPLLAAFQMFGWAYGPLAAVLAAAPSGLIMDQAALLVDVFGLAAPEASHIRDLVRGRDATTVLTVLAQQLSFAGPGLQRQVLANGSGQDGVGGWSVLENSWQVASGYADALGWTTSFTAGAGANGWCRKSQLIDLRAAAGLTDPYLDGAPDLGVSDWVSAVTTAGCQYYLRVRLLDAAGQVVKDVRSDTVDVIPATGIPYRPDWRQILLRLRDYGPGVRYVSVEHGGRNPSGTDTGHGFQVTGTTVRVLIGPGPRPAELVGNPDGAGQLTGWTSATGAGTWVTEPDSGIACPGSASKAAFAVASGTATKYQVIDLVEAGYRTDFLDQAPTVRIGQWMAADPEVTCTYAVRAELRNAEDTVLATVDSGAVEVRTTNLRTTAFQSFFQTVSQYGPGLRKIRIEHSATPARQVAGRAAAKIAGTSVRVLDPQPDPDPLTARAVAGPPLANTANKPYRWVCLFSINWQAGRSSAGSGWLIPTSKPGSYYVMTAAHNVCHGTNGWAKSIDITPGANGSTFPYAMVNVPLENMEIPLDWLAVSQARILPVYCPPVHDYALIRVNSIATPRWDSGGFTPTVMTDNQLTGQAAQLTGYPADRPFPLRHPRIPARMYEEPVTLSVYDDLLAELRTNMRGGASGSPIHILDGNTYKAVGVFSHGEWRGGYDITFELGYDHAYIRRIDQRVLDDVERWRTRLDDNDRICKLLLVIRTGYDATTSDPLACNIDGHDYDLTQLWSQGAAHWYGGRNRGGDYDVYDLTPELYRAHPGGPLLSQLLGKNYSIRRTESTSYRPTEWQVDSVSFFVNDQLLGATTLRRLYRSVDTVDGLIQRGG
ncbi:hypothetical protein [Nonomuraea insulae]|uniref:FBA domain-containing protein n=1 Tax=Nonomuraea insulae TaxID=1616787 RepID=A0ABW1CVR2_9ACTN